MSQQSKSLTSSAVFDKFKSIVPARVLEELKRLIPVSVTLKLKDIFHRLNIRVPSRVFVTPLIAIILLNLSVPFAEDLFVGKNPEMIQKYEYENFLLEKENNALLQQIHMDNDRYYSDVLCKLLPKDKLIELARQSWKYSVNVNDTEVTKANSNSIDPKSSTVRIVIVETLINDKLPMEIARLGSIETEVNSKSEKSNIKSMNSSEKLSNSIKVTSQKAENTVEEKREEDRMTIIYTFTDVEVGEIISLKLNSNIRNQLKLDNEVIEIFNTAIEN